MILLLNVLVYFFIVTCTGQDDTCRFMNCFRGIAPHHSRNCYCIVTEKKNWHMARQNCSARSMRLVMIESAQEEKMLTTFLETRGYGNLGSGFWTAGTDNENEGLWKWASRNDLGFDHDILYNNWCPGEPNNFQGRENYLLKLWTNPSLVKIESCWYDAPPEWENLFICEDGPAFY